MHLPLLHRPALFLVAMAPFVGLLSADVQAQQLCDQAWPDGQEIAELSDPTIDESSGLADSWIHPDRLWTHNDSSDHPRLWAMDKQGQVHTEVWVDGADNIDWEDMAIAPCSLDGPPCIYAGDIGDNLSQRDDVQIYRFPEPDLGDDPPESWTVDADDVEILTYEYDTGPRDAEALLVHPQTLEMWVIEKTGDPEVKVFQIPPAFDASDPPIVEPIAILTIDGPHELLRMVTAADISPDGTEFTLRTYGETFRYCVSDPDDFASAFDAQPTTNVVDPPTVQGEALTYDRADGALWLTSEQLPAPLIRLPPIEAPDDENNGDDNGDDEHADDNNSHDDESDPSSTSSCAAAAPQSPLWPLVLLGLIGLAAFRARRA